MEVKRTQAIETSIIEIGDVIAFELTDGEKVEVMAVEKTGEGTVFCFVDCIKQEYPMNKRDKNDGGFAASDLSRILNTVILGRMPKDILEKMKMFPDGGLLRIPTEKEIFGENPWGEKEPEDTKQWEPMKLRRNRIAFEGLNGNWQWYWLQNAAVASSTYFAYCNSYGLASYYYASNTYGVRPVFLIG